MKDTLLVWNEVDANGGVQDLALSFQEEAGCSEVWSYIKEKQESFSLNSLPELFRMTVYLGVG